MCTLTWQNILLYESFSDCDCDSDSDDYEKTTTTKIMMMIKATKRNTKMTTTKQVRNIYS